MITGVPVIDLTDGDEGAVGAACHDWGFFQIVRHGIPAGLIEQVFDQSRRFFALPLADKRAVLRSQDNPRGYYDRELTKNARDLKEVFDFGLEPHPELASDHPLNRLPVDGHNQWPTGLPGFKETMTDYLRACEALGHRLLESFCLGIGAPHDRLRPYFGADHTSFARLNHYPLDDPLEPEQAAGTTALGDMALHHHSDAGVLTILLQDEVGGLQVFTHGAWLDIAPLPGALVINVGDMMQVWSNDRYPAALHRVRPGDEPAAPQCAVLLQSLLCHRLRPARAPRARRAAPLPPGQLGPLPPAAYRRRLRRLRQGGAARGFSDRLSQCHPPPRQEA